MLISCFPIPDLSDYLNHLSRTVLVEPWRSWRIYILLTPPPSLVIASTLWYVSLHEDVVQVLPNIVPVPAKLVLQSYASRSGLLLSELIKGQYQLHRRTVHLVYILSGIALSPSPFVLLCCMLVSTGWPCHSGAPRRSQGNTFLICFVLSRGCFSGSLCPILKLRQSNTLVCYGSSMLYDENLHNALLRWKCLDLKISSALNLLTVYVKNTPITGSP